MTKSDVSGTNPRHEKFWVQLRCCRCSRLGIECMKQAAVVRNRRQQKTAYACHSHMILCQLIFLEYISRLAQLEERLESIVSLLTPPQQPVQEKEHSYPTPGPSQIGSAIPIPSIDYLDGPSTVRSHESCSSDGQRSAVASYSEEDVSTDLRVVAMSSGQLPNAEIISGLDPGPEQADILLDVFQTQMAEHFPFVVIPPGTTAQCLCRDKPFLYQMIMLSASGRNLWDPKTCRRLVMEYLGLHLLIREEKSLDLLQGILVYISWSVMRIRRLYKKMYQKKS